MRKLNKQSKKEMNKLLKILKEKMKNEEYGFTINYSDVFMPICINFINEYKNAFLMSIAHYSEMNGDLMADPEMTFMKSIDGEWYAIGFRNDYIGSNKSSCKLDHDGNPKILSIEMQRDMSIFANKWIKNFKCQQNI